MKRGIHPSFIISIIFFILVILAGSVVYHKLEGWNTIDSVYFVSVTVTTIGYGDLYPTTEASKIFTIFFSYFGVAFALYYLALINHFLLKKHLRGKLKKGKP